MSIAVVARHDAKQLLRSQFFTAVVVVSLVACVGGVFAGSLLGAEQGPTSVLRLQLLTTWLVAGLALTFTGIFVGAAGLTSERKNDTLRLLGSLPLSRSDVLYGKALTRITVVTVGVCVGLAVSLAVVVLDAPVTATGRVLGFAAFTVAATAAYVAVGVAVSTVVTASRVRAVTAAVFAGTVVWPRLCTIIIGVVDGERLVSLLKFAAVVTPFGAYSQVVSDQNAILAFEVDSIFLGSGVMAVVILVWMVVPLAVARRAFERRDI